MTHFDGVGISASVEDISPKGGGIRALKKIWPMSSLGWS